ERDAELEIGVIQHDGEIVRDAIVRGGEFVVLELEVGLRVTEIADERDVRAEAVAELYTIDRRSIERKLRLIRELEEVAVPGIPSVWAEIHRSVTGSHRLARLLCLEGRHDGRQKSCCDNKLSHCPS